MKHLPEYLIEAWGLGTFMLVAGACATLLYTDIVNIPNLIPNPAARDLLMGIAMGITAMALIYSPWGKRSGAHLNPAVTITFFRLGKLNAIDTCFYCLFQILGGIGGVFLIGLSFGNVFTNRPPTGLNYLVTVPNKSGWIGALVAEFIIAYLMMTMVLWASNHPKFAKLTGVFAGSLVALFVIFAAPYSGFGMNPARSFASAVLANTWDFFWIYYFVPPLTMLFAAEVYLWMQKNSRSVPKNICGKLCPNSETSCLCQNPCDTCCAQPKSVMSATSELHRH